MDVRARAVFYTEEPLALELGLVAWREVRAAAEEVRQILRKDVEHIAADRTCCF
ncbi:hypothetical protein SDC9_186692 [bioreactor metagenome]|uniref:Uncharacterized protein n=1 Tax=bioreactor metagenome TaxID=1076179 RepID=A0A645HSN4_9ZZZZ